MHQTPRESGILVVEDEVIVAEDIRITLEDLGYRVVATCATGNDAIAHARALRPDLILMDIHLRGEMDGLEAATRITDEQDIPIVFLTAHHDDETLSRAAKVQPYGFIIKPFEERELHSIIGITLFKHQMESRLKASERWLAAVLRGIGDAVVTVDTQGLVRSMNPQAEVLTGWRQQEAIGQPVDRVLPLDDGSSADAPLSLSGESERLLRTRSRQRLPIEMTASAIVDEREGDVGTVIIFRNISQRKAMERTLVQQAEELRRSNDELQRFAYVVSHDLRSPLSVVGMSMSALQRVYAKHLDERGQRFVERGNQGVQRMSQLIDDLLSYARVQSQASPLEPISAEETLQAATENLEAAIVESHAQITHDPLPQVLADRTQFLQLLQNLLSNAIAYRREEPPRIHVAAQDTGEGWLFRVQDNGVGIAAEERERIFEMFHRVASQNHRSGTGIGLATCKRIVERHGGRIWVESQPGRGSTFFFTLPSSPPPPVERDDVASRAPEG